MDRDIAVVDYGNGNIGSLMNMFEYLGTAAKVASSPSQLASARAIVLPGVGHFGRAAERLQDTGLGAKIVDVAKTGMPVLGICLGMQLLFERSDEGQAHGLNLIPGRVEHLKLSAKGQELRYPNVGWRDVEPVSAYGEELMALMLVNPRFYFLHSFRAVCSRPEDVVLTSKYGSTFACGVSSGNVTGVQFHPEKSHAFGLTLLSNWIGGLK